MPILVLGLVVFLGAHSVRLVAEDWRTRRVAAVGEKRWKRLFSVISLVGLVLTIWGYAMARQEPVLLWASPVWTRHAASLLVLVGFIFISSAHAPPNHFRASLHHPMYAGTALWAIGHLLANGMLADLLLFGAFLAWSVAGFLTWRARDRVQARSYPAGTARGTVGAIVVGTVLWAVFAFLLHGPLIGVRPF
jgi:uncharacterized membrane protein